MMLNTHKMDGLVLKLVLKTTWLTRLDMDSGSCMIRCNMMTIQDTTMYLTETMNNVPSVTVTRAHD